MGRDTTRNLSHILEETRTQHKGDSFISLYSSAQSQSLSQYLQEIISSSGLHKSTVIRRCGLDRCYAYNILSGRRRNPSRDRLLAICIASEMTYRQTQRALELAGLAPLYPRNSRDVRIAIAINSGQHEVIRVNLMLDEYGLEPLDI